MPKPIICEECGNPIIGESFILRHPRRVVCHHCNQTHLQKRDHQLNWLLGLERAYPYA